MIELRTLGALDLRRVGGPEFRAVLQQPKRLGLLAYLALATPRRFHRRDTLLAQFWPELDQEHARAALRRALYFLRRSLEGEVLIGRGEEEVGIDPGLLWCDARAFEERLDAGAPAEALELYQGDLLDGFYVTGAPEVERWLDGERTRLRERASSAAWSLADSAPADADRMRWARRAAAMTPDDEGSLRRLVELLDHLGDRTGAIRAYEEFARRLKFDYELEPGPEIRGLIAELHQRQPTPSRAVRPAAPPPPRVVAVCPFAIHGNPDYSYLAEGMVDLLSTALDGAGDLTTVDPRALLGAARAGEALDPEHGRQIAARFGAGRFLLGSVVAAGGRLQAVATLYDADARPVARAEAKRDHEAELFDLVDDLVRQLLAGGEHGPAARLIRLAALTTVSLAALKSYLQGESAIRLGRYLEAIDSFQQAVSLDDSFALAHFRLASALAANVMIVPAREAIARAWQHRDRMSERDQLLLGAQRAWLLGRTTEAERLVGTLVALYPEDVEAWFLMGDLHFHTNPARGRPAAAARDAFERVLTLDPGHMGALVHLVRIAALERRTADVTALVERAELLSPSGDQALGIRALRAWAGGDSSLQEAVLAQIPAARALAAGTAFADLAVYAGDLAGAERFWSHCLAAARSEELKALYRILGSSVAFGRGRRSEALEYLREAARVDPDAALQVRGMLLATAMPPVSTDQLEAVREELLAWNVAAAREPSLPFPIHEGLHPHFRCYLLGLIEAALGQSAAPAERAEEMAELTVPAGAEALVERLARTLEAVHHRINGRPAEALRVLEGAETDVWFQLAIASPFYAGAYERLLRADLLVELGRPEEARGWLETIAQRSPFEAPFVAAAGERLRAVSLKP
jgi:serine/threonine-protein kinase